MTQKTAETSVIVPTYREAENIDTLIERATVALNSAGGTWELLVVDAHSDDGTAELARAHARDKPVRVLDHADRPLDLSRQLLAGIDAARYKRIVVLDADLQHPPEAIPSLLAALDAGAQMAIGSRYVATGSVDAQWGPGRRMLSRIACLLAQPIAGVRDGTSGFFAFEHDAAPDRASIQPIGYKLGLELIVRGRMRTAEVPIRFGARQRGSSKLNWRAERDYLRHLAKLYALRAALPTRIVLFGLVGATGVSVDAAGFLTLEAAGLDHRVARTLSFWPAVTCTWFGNRHVTFADRSADAPPAPQWARFACTALLGASVNIGTYLALTGHVPWFEGHHLLALATGVVCGAAINFAVASSIVFQTQTATTQRQTPHQQPPQQAKCSDLEAQTRRDRYAAHHGWQEEPCGPASTGRGARSSTAPQDGHSGR